VDDDPFPERFVPGEMRGLIEVEHLARYWWAAGCVKDRTVLDAGCGVGYGAALLAALGARAVTAVDNAPDAVAAARERGGSEVDVIEADISALPFAEDSFDVVVCFETLEHVTDQPKALDELRRILRPGGVLLISSPNHDVIEQGNPHHTHEYTPEELRGELSARFENVHLERQQTWLTSMISPDDVLLETDPARTLDLAVRKLAAVPAGGERFTLAVASEGRLPTLGGLAMLTDTAELEAWKRRAVSAERHAERSRRDAAEAAEAYRDASAAYTDASAAHDAIVAERGKLEEALARLNGVLAERQAALEVADQERATLRLENAGLRVALGDAQAISARMEASLSWRLTAPLRSLRR
jgi:SAM-dependent methyltransferase